MARHKVKTADSIPLAQPDRSSSRRAAKTLYEIAAERHPDLPLDSTITHASLDPGTVRSTPVVIDAASATPADEGSEDEDSPVLDALLYSTTLTMAHGTLDVLVFHQYGQEIDWAFVARRLPVTFLALVLIIYLFHTRLARRMKAVRDVFLATVGAVIGAYLVNVTNTHPYLAVMLKAPPLGVFWVWTVLEVDWRLASLQVLAVGAYAYWNEMGLY